MSSRKCGYCRDVGHMSNVCPVRLGQIDDIKRHYVGERRALHEMVVRDGLGIGSIFKMKDYADNMFICTIRSHNSIVDNNSFIDSRDMRYMKSTRITYNAYSRVKHTNSEESRFNHYSERAWFYLVINPLDNMARNMYMSVGIATREDGTSYINYQFSNIEMLSPSNDTDMNSDMYYRPYYLPRRLVGNKAQAYVIPSRT